MFGWKEITPSARLSLLVFYGVLELTDPKDCTPRKTIPYQSANLNVFWKPRLSNFSALLISEGNDILYVAARNYILALDLNDVSKEIAREAWFAPEERQLECLRRGKSKAECQNYILILHQINSTSLYVCGTNAFHPACRCVVTENRKFRFHTKAVESRGRCPFGPTTRHASLMVDGALYSATSNNFLGTEPIILRSFKNPLRTEFKASWLNASFRIKISAAEPPRNELNRIPPIWVCGAEYLTNGMLENPFDPTFVQMGLGQEGDRIYIFFTETATEFEFYDRLLVSRVAQICKGDLGGRRTLKKRWSSFLKSTLVCSAPEADFQFNVLQDIYVLKTDGGRETLFYGIFTQQWGQLDISSVCVFKAESIQDVFLKGNFRGPSSVENPHAKRVVPRKDSPDPHPGACLDISAGRGGVNSSLDFPDRVLHFVRDHPLMDDTVRPLDNRPVLLKKGVQYTRLVVDRARGLDNTTYDVLFLGTDKGYLHKALSYQGELWMMEEIQLFPSPEPVLILQLCPQKGLLFAASPSRLVQLPIASCGWYKRCLDCVLARSPYCAWSPSLRRCVPTFDHHGNSKELIQSVRNGDASMCPPTDAKVKKYLADPGSSRALSCTPLSNLAISVWTLNRSLLPEDSAKYLFHPRGVVVFDLTAADTGLYECRSIEKAGGREFRLTVSAYHLQLRPGAEGERPRQACAFSAAPKNGSSALARAEHPLRQEQPWRNQGLLFTLMLFASLFAFLFISLLSWNIYKGHVFVPWKTAGRGDKAGNAARRAGPEPGLHRVPSGPKPVGEWDPLQETGHAKPKLSPRKAGSVCNLSSCLTPEDVQIPARAYEV